MEEIEKEAVRTWYPRLHEIDLLTEDEKTILRLSYDIWGDESLSTNYIIGLIERTPVYVYRVRRRGLSKLTAYYLQNVAPHLVDEYATSHRMFNQISRRGVRAISERDAQIVRLRRSGMVFREIARQYGLSKTRCRQIFHRRRDEVTSAYHCSDCDTHFDFLGDRMDAQCPDCKSIHVKLA